MLLVNALPGKAYIYNFDETIPESEANAKLVLGAIYILLGMGIIAMCVNLMQEKIITEVKIRAYICFKYFPPSLCPGPTVNTTSGTDPRIPRC